MDKVWPGHNGWSETKEVWKAGSQQSTIKKPETEGAGWAAEEPNLRTLKLAEAGNETNQKRPQSSCLRLSSRNTRPCQQNRSSPVQGSPAWFSQGKRSQECVAVPKGQTAGHLCFAFGLSLFMGASPTPSSVSGKICLTFQVETEPDHLVSFSSLATLREQ